MNVSQKELQKRIDRKIEGKYYDAMQASVSDNISKQFWFKKKVRSIY